MISIKDDMEGGLWTTIKEQHGLPGQCRVSLYQFDDKWEAVFEGKPSGEITQEDCRLVPRGSTALHDAIVKSLAAAEARILAEPEDERPKIVVAVVITDGRENASGENKAADSRKAIERATEKFGWKFAFLAADPKGFSEGRAMTVGIRGTSAGSYAASDVKGTHRRYSSAIADLRSGIKDDIDVTGPDDDGDDAA